MTADLGRPYKAENGMIFTGLPGGLERLWWIFGNRGRAAGVERTFGGTLDAQENLVEAWEAGWDAMDERLEAKTA